jgi:hypothetical protein
MKSNDPEWKSYGSIDNGENGFPADLKYSIKLYRKNEILFRQGSICDALNILTSGSVKTEMITETGNIMGIELIKAPRPLAPAFLFSDNNRFPVDVTAIESCEILRIPKEEVMRLMAIQPDFMEQFLKHNANRTEFLANRIQLLSIKTIKDALPIYYWNKCPNTEKRSPSTETKQNWPNFLVWHDLHWPEASRKWLKTALLKSTKSNLP